MGNVKFGWKAGTEQYGPQDLLQYAVGAEQAGFDSIEASDHFHPGPKKARRASSGLGSAPWPPARSEFGWARA
jgi:coenzyme F420-dependent glucose-6-phosphate dehydrogenase